VKRFMLQLLLVTVCMFVSVYGAILMAAGSTGGSLIELDAKQISGKIYVKAESLTDKLGGSGSYDSKSKTFRYSPIGSITDVVDQVSPSVVAVIGKPDVGDYQSIDRFMLAHGTGVIVSKDGWIVTNAHVVEDMKEIIVLADNDKQYKAVKIVKDEESDLALIKIAATGLKPAKFFSGEVRVGETVVAIGTPVSFSMRNSATVGVISGINRSVNGSYRLLQTDAAINPGNSGGPLVNQEGEIIGINSLKFVDVSVDSMGFSIPSGTVQYIVNQLMTNGKVKRVSLGLQFEESWEAVIGLSTDKPLTVTLVDKLSSAGKQGIVPGDQLLSVNKVKIVTLVDLNESLKRFKPGDKLQVTLLSGGDIIHKTITLHEKR
jgi:serine protease Do